MWDEVFPPTKRKKEKEKKKSKQVAEHHKMYMYIALEKNGSKQKNAQIEEGHTISSPDD